VPPTRIGEMLVARGLLTPASVDRALGFQRSTAARVKLGSILLTWDLIDERRLLEALAALHRCEAVTGEMLAAAPIHVVQMLPAPHALRLNAIPYDLRKSRIRVAFVNPSNLEAIDEVSALTGHVCVPGVATELRLLQAHRRFYGRTLPLELRPTIPRIDAARPSSAVRAPNAPQPSAIILVNAERAGEGPASEPSQITVPEIPIPSPPASHDATAPETEGADPTASSMWISNRPSSSPVEDAFGMWSHAAQSLPATAPDLGDIALAAVPSEFGRAILLTDRDGSLVAWRARGIPSDMVAEIRLPEAEVSVFSLVARTSTPHFGRVDPEQWPEMFARRLEGPPPCAVLPVQTGHGLAAILYADRRGAPMRFEDLGLLSRAAAGISALLARARPGRID